MRDAIEQFRDSIRAAGLTPPDAIIDDGKLRRFASNGKRGDDAGWYVFHANGIAAGSFGDWRTGVSETWRADIGRTLTASEEAAHPAKAEAMRKQCEADEAEGHAKAAEQAAARWQESPPATADHPYLKRKCVKPHGTRVGRDGWLLIPMRDASGKLWNVERIAPAKPDDGGGDKRGLYRGRRTGCYYSIGGIGGAAALCIVEGFATGATVHEATGYPVAVAFNAGNLLPVAKALRDKFPDLPLILCADDDARTDGNPGMTKATEAARAVGGLVAMPDFGADRPDGASDFNDLAAARGLEAVNRAIASAAASVVGSDPPATENGAAGDSAVPDEASGLALPHDGVTGVTGVQANGDAASRVTPDADQGVTGVTPDGRSPIPDEAGRPAFRVFDDFKEHGGRKYPPGVWYFGIKAGKGDTPPTPTDTRICSPLHVEAVTFDGQDNNFGRLLRFRNTLGRWREWAMPMELLRASGDELRGELLAMGVEIDPSAKTLLANYLQATPPKRRMRCALQVGWCDGSFVLPDAVIGPRASGVIFQSGERGHDEHTKAGTLAGWQTEIAARAISNPLLLLALSASFAGPLLSRCNAEGGGIHLVGDSSTGKTTVIEAACATWGGPNYRRSWRATANGMEGAAALFNDCLLALDEISECDPREVGAIVYALGNGRGKQRANRLGSARGVTRWRCYILSSGERTIATAMQEGGHRAKAGQSIRLLDIPAARAYGAWDDLHGAATGAAFADAIKRAAVTHHGHAGRAFLERLTRDDRDYCGLLERIKALPAFSAEGGEGQDKRAAARFALVALAGEVATEYGLTGWPEGAAIHAAAEGFKAWQGLRGRGNDERRQILDRVSGFLERHGDARFSNAEDSEESPVRDRAGWWRDSSEGRVYLFTAEGMREAVKGFDFNRALEALQEAGALPAPEADGKRSTPQRFAGRLVRVYPIHDAKLGVSHGA
ncbi:MAG: hypothetical protein BroJett026_34670 [Betaproteobacteria bacterium]|nr:MAG: hypothetical protein BroJett026_34670 [Betaproteobacteria bacterium]